MPIPLAGNFGLKREEATKAVRKISCVDKEGNAVGGLETVRFSINGIVFSLYEQLDDGCYSAICEQTGSEGNSFSGAILPIDHVGGLASAILNAEAIIAAQDEESDDQLRERLYRSVRSAAFGGNKADYQQKALSITGVGECAVFTASDAMGAGNVGLVIANEQGEPASDELIGEVEALFCGDMPGNGFAPIGHNVSVNNCEWLDLNISAVVTLKSGSSFEVVLPFIQNAVEEYINNIRFNETTVFSARIASAILTCHEAIIDVGNVSINQAEGNIPLEKSFEHWQVPCVESVSIEVN